MGNKKEHVKCNDRRKPKKLMDRVRKIGRLKHYSIRTEQAYVGWILRHIHFHNKRHPNMDFDMNEIIVRDGKGFKDRIALLPEPVQPKLREHLERVKILHEKDLADGCGSVYLPDLYACSQATRYPND